MSLGSFLMVLGSILAFGFMCFIGGTDGPGVVVDDGRRIRRVSPGAAASELLDFFDNALFQSL